MSPYNRTIRIFAGMDINQICDNLKSQIKASIENETENYLFNVDIAEYTKHLIDKFSISIAEIDFESLYADDYQKEIYAEYFPNGFNVSEGRSYPKQVIVYHIPYKGDKQFFEFKPSEGWIIWSMDISVEDDSLSFEVINFYDDSEKIKREADENIKRIRQNYDSLKKQCEKFNSSLATFITATIEATKQKYSKHQNFRASLGVPFKKKTDVAETFSVPNPQVRKKISVNRPVVSQDSFKPEPTLSEENFRQILKIINDVGKTFERLPSTYVGKDEESLRDHILLVLEPNFEGGSVTGETFNKTGKTDILLRYEGTNIFVAECKFWHGEKQYLEAIDQLLGYLTWRDSKVALILFVKNKDFSNVLDTICKITPTHSNYKKYLQNINDAFFEYEFHLNGDESRIIHLSVMAFHLPE